MQKLVILLGNFTRTLWRRLCQLAYIDSTYHDIPILLLELPSLDLKMKVDWTLDQSLSNLQSCSTTVDFKKERRQNSLGLIHTALNKLGLSKIYLDISPDHSHSV